MSSLRLSQGTEPVASDVQPGGYHDEGDVVQCVGGMLYDGTGWIPAKAANVVADGAEGNSFAPTSPRLLNAAGTYDRQRNNINRVVCIAEGAYTTTQTSSQVVNYNHSKLIAYLRVGKAGSGTLKLALLNEAGTAHVTFTPTTTSMRYAVAPGLVTGNGETVGETILSIGGANTVVPAKFALSVIPSGSTSWEYEVRYDLLV